MEPEKKTQDLIGPFAVKPFSANRRLISEVYDEFLKKHYMAGFFEVDVTLGRRLIADFEKRTGEKISFTGWFAKCVSEAVREFPDVNAFRWGRKKAVLFEDIDIIVMVERRLTDKVIPVPYAVRRSQAKDLLTISREIRTAQTASVSEKEQLLDRSWKVRLFRYVPGFVRRRVLARMTRNPFYVKRQGGLIIITAVGMFTNTRLWVGGFGGITTLSLTLGGIARRLVKQGEEIVEREFLQVTAYLDHDIVDGGPATRLQARIVQLIETGHGLRELVQG
ncbi:MAG TPA: 2-oxo acid dehydrogenase subunit E2 [Acidobacteriota bacterium]|nr:2-oxo acid dehydrogenase subunit E2 [Acidobacteriota bacterium]